MSNLIGKLTVTCAFVVSLTLSVSHAGNKPVVQAANQNVGDVSSLVFDPKPLAIEFADNELRMQTNEVKTSLIAFEPRETLSDSFDLKTTGGSQLVFKAKKVMLERCLRCKPIDKILEERAVQK